MDGRGPVAGARIFVCQTDAPGFYSRPANDPRKARLRGAVYSDGQGFYEIRTIKPAHYANVNPPPAAHIQVHLAAEEVPEHWI